MWSFKLCTTACESHRGCEFPVGMCCVSHFIAAATSFCCGRAVHVTPRYGDLFRVQDIFTCNRPLGLYSTLEALLLFTCIIHRRWLKTFHMSLVKNVYDEVWTKHSGLPYDESGYILCTTMHNYEQHKINIVC